MKQRVLNILLIVLAMLVALLAIMLGIRVAYGRRARTAGPEQPALIAHAGGAIYGYRQTNSLEALNQAYENGFRYIELDFQLTSDGQLVLLHDWDAMAERMLGAAGPMTAEAFHQGTAFAEDLTVLDAGGLLRWMKRHKNVYIITDVKAEDNVSALALLKAQAGDLYLRFIPQIYDYTEYDPVRALGYDQVILTLYRMEPDPADVAEFAASHALWAVTVSERVLTDELLKAVAATGTPVYAHTINTLAYYEQRRDLGLTGIYTDYFSPAHWPR